MHDKSKSTAFKVLTEIGITNQLATALLEAHLPDGLIAAHFAVLNHLIRTGDGQTPLEIARALQVPKTSFSNTLAGLEKRNLVEVRPNPRDQRSKTISLTAQGQRVHVEIVAALGPAFQDLTNSVEPGTFDALLPLLRELRAKMDASRPTV